MLCSWEVLADFTPGGTLANQGDNNDMVRVTLVILLSLVLAGCASVRAPADVVASTRASEASEQLECMSDCLAGGDESCEGCVARCLDSTPVSILTAASYPQAF